MGNEPDMQCRDCEIKNYLKSINENLNGISRDCKNKRRVNWDDVLKMLFGKIIPLLIVCATILVLTMCENSVIKEYL